SRILYRAAEGETVEIKGSEIIKGWKKAGKDLWSVTVPNSMFGDFNPFAEEFKGDWLDTKFPMHLGDVYLNDVSLYEAKSVDSLRVVRKTLRDPQGVCLNWFASVDETATTITACFDGADPNKETVEINVRPTCFYPTREGVNYITVRGFRISQAATQWAAPTAEQIGMVAPHWGKGWIIEDNILKNSHASGITLGKEAGTGQDEWSKDERHIDGSIHYLETIFKTLRKGWDKENIGSHIVRNNIISDCGQAGICGSMGCAFSEIYGNEIFNVFVKGTDQYNGAELSGIKFHGGIDTYIHDNRIHDCNQAVWLDWMGQGARVSSNLFYDNWQQDLFIEMVHGPYMVDNNIMLSEYSLLDAAEGGAYVHNFIYGKIRDISWEDLRFVPYNLPHSTSIKGISRIDHSDCRFFNNIFCSNDGDTSWDLERYKESDHPAVVEGNVILRDQSFELHSEGDDVFLSFGPMKLPANRGLVDSGRLGVTFLSDCGYENPDGTPISFDEDYFHEKRPGTNMVPGPFATFPDSRIKVWK
ncbi:MAG: right-handed parallel beta-helix repeat-containing protein, partial [Bacteroidales bacterium]|nr:right-handed parallel beta-helix repeat-containing protein [Bacteroidales bacterium]